MLQLSGDEKPILDMTAQTESGHANTSLNAWQRVDACLARILVIARARRRTQNS